MPSLLGGFEGRPFDQRQKSRAQSVSTDATRMTSVHCAAGCQRQLRRTASDMVAVQLRVKKHRPSSPATVHAHARTGHDCVARAAVQTAVLTFLRAHSVRVPSAHQRELDVLQLAEMCHKILADGAATEDGDLCWKCARLLHCHCADLVRWCSNYLRQSVS